MAKVAAFKHLFTDTVTPTAATTRCRFVDANGDILTTAGARARGVSIDSATAAEVTAGAKIGIVIIGIVELEAGAAIALTDKLTGDTSGRAVPAVAGQTVNAYPLTTAANAGDRISALVIQGAASAAPQIVSFPIKLAKITGAGDVVTNFTPGFAGRIKSVAFVVTDPVTTAAKLATLNLEIGATDLTGGAIALTSAAATPLGKVIAGTAITAGNVFSATDTISVEAAAVTAFAEGEGVLQITLESLVP